MCKSVLMSVCAAASVMGPPVSSLASLPSLLIAPKLCIMSSSSLRLLLPPLSSLLVISLHCVKGGVGTFEKPARDR